MRTKIDKKEYIFRLSLVFHYIGCNEVFLFFTIDLMHLWIKCEYMLKTA
jgi:hypothetical protein